MPHPEMHDFNFGERFISNEHQPACVSRSSEKLSQPQGH
jgi:hypothetical protein